MKECYKLPFKELVELLIFSGTIPQKYTKQDLNKWVTAYRKAEFESNQQIKKYGCIEKWYESGEGRLI